MGRAVRLRYTGLVAFLTRIGSVFTGLAFTVLVTRNLTVPDFGLWQYISILCSYLLFPNFLMNYWSTRFTARGYRVGRTHVILSTYFSLAALFVFLAVSVWGSRDLTTDLGVFFLASLTIPFLYLYQALEALAYGHRPELPQYGFIIFEVSKVVLGVVFVLLLRMGFYGVLISVILAYALQATFLAITQLDLLKGVFDRSIASRWIRSSWLPAYGMIPSMLLGLDALLVTIISRSTEPIAYWRAAQVIFGMIGYSTYLASALYPKMLSGGGGKDVEVALRLVLMFSVPMVIGAFVLAKPLLAILKAEYVIASDVVRVGVFVALISAITNVFSGAISGLEGVDKEGQLSFRKLLRSKLFLIPSVNIVASSAYIVSLIVIAQLLLSYNAENVYIAIPFYANIGLLIVNAFTLLYLYGMLRKMIKFSFPTLSVLKYVVASLPMVIVFYLYPPARALTTVAEALLGGCIYFLLLFLIDREARDLFVAGIKYMGNKFSQK
ncbi:MAG: hypothetical protein RMJ14_00240 [Nitrososphaerota archaeon]|nr:hypothetical protein [Aigarchaeota archaeon]MDW8076061.1 hypothetical protein [Nitrososphaerota archaeon]